MLRWRALGGIALAALLGGVSPALGVDAGSRAAVDQLAAHEAGSLEIYYTSPVLARAGEQVLMPVQVVCAQGGRACEASVTLSTRVGDQAWRSVTARGAPELVFDLSAPAARAVVPAGAGSVQFVIRARDESGRQTTLPPSGEAAPLAFFVTTRMPVRHITSIPFGRTRRGTTVLSLPWGSGSMRAGLSPGRESAPLGPASFDVDRRGRIYLLDPGQGRLALFASGRLIRQTALPLTANAQLAADPHGVVRVVDRSSGMLVARAVDASGVPKASGALMGSMVDAVRIAGGQAYGLVLPLDAWVGMGPASPPLVGMPLPGGGQLLRIARPEGIRLARWTLAGQVRDAVELRAAARIGEIPLAEPDGRDGCWIVVHLWREAPVAADQYEVLHVMGARVLASFAVADRAFTDTPPLSRFRIGGDGALYQLVSTDAGIRIVRFDLKEDR
jgi:hypothetical protein